MFFLSRNLPRMLNQIGCDLECLSVDIMFLQPVTYNPHGLKQILIQ